MLVSRCLCRGVWVCRLAASTCTRLTPAYIPHSTPRKLLSTSQLSYQDQNPPDPKVTFDEEKTEKEPDLDEIKSQILDHALEYVSLYGWTRKAISQGCEDAGYPSVSDGMFDNEGGDLVMHFVKKSNLKLVDHMQEKLREQKESGEKLNVGALIRDTIEYRLRLIIPYIDVWPQAMQLLLSPKMLSVSTAELGRMVDDIWYLAGDRSADFNWYTKRGFLAKLYGSTQLYMLRDQSPDFQDTWLFLDRRLVLVAFLYIQLGLHVWLRNFDFYL